MKERRFSLKISKVVASGTTMIIKLIVMLILYGKIVAVQHINVTSSHSVES